MRYCQIQCNFRDSEYLCKLGKQYLNTLLCNFYTFFWTKFANFWHITRLSITNHRKLINIQKWSVFLAHPVSKYLLCLCPTHRGQRHNGFVLRIVLVSQCQMIYKTDQLHRTILSSDKICRVTRKIGQIFVGRLYHPKSNTFYFQE